MRSVIDTLFRLSLAGFLIIGTALVAAQLAGVVGLSGSIVSGAANTLGPPAFVLAGITGVLAYVLSYLGGTSRSAREEEG